MNIKSLLIGSAAALVAVSGARAADAVVAEPEAVEYVRVCDAAGAGYFYIPGGETCLKIGGYVRYQIDYANRYQDAKGDGTDGWRKSTSFRLEFSTWSDTEMGALTSYIRIGGATGVVPDLRTINPNDGTYNTSLGFEKATIGLGGLTMGYHDTEYDAGLDAEYSEGGGGTLNFIKYKFASGGVAATLSLEEETYDDNYIPNIVGHISYAMGSVNLEGWVAYDDKDFGIDPAGWSVKGRVSAPVGSAGSLKLLATYNSNNNYYANGGKWTIGASYAHKVSDKLTLSGLVQYFADTNYATAGTPSTVLVSGVVDYTITPGFDAKLAIGHKFNSGTTADATAAFLRFQRSF